MVLGLMVYALAREQTLPLLLGWALLFGLYLLLIWGAKESPLWLLLLLAAAARLLLLPSVPSLSDDYFRFLWDGHLLLAGEHPFAHAPVWYRQADAPEVAGLTTELYKGLNSPTYFTIYPPLAQALFALAARIGENNIYISIVALRLPLMLVEGLAIWLMLRLLPLYRLPRHRVLLYALNPLVILELAGNLHMEALLLPFILLLLWGLHLLGNFSLRAAGANSSLGAFSSAAVALNKAGVQQIGGGSRSVKWGVFLVSAGFAGAVASKLWPLLLGPFILLKIQGKVARLWLLLSAVLLLLLFLPLYDSALFSGMSSSFSLYFQHFEFNASLYYMLRYLGTLYAGYNLIGLLGPGLGLLATGLILFFSNKSVQQAWSIPKTIMLLYGLFLLCATTVHPWYVIPLLVLMPFTNYKFPLLWSGLVFLTYAGYAPAGYKEPILLVVLEYALVLGMLCWELRHRGMNNSSLRARHHTLTAKVYY